MLRFSIERQTMFGVNFGHARLRSRSSALISGCRPIDKIAKSPKG